MKNVREELKKEMQAQEGPVEIQIKYSDTDQTIRREALRLLKEWGYDEPPERYYKLSAFPYKEEVTGSNPVAPTRVFRELALEK